MCTNSLPNLVDSSASLLGLSSTAEKKTLQTSIAPQNQGLRSALQLSSASTVATLLSRNAATGASQIWSVNGSTPVIRQDLPTETDDNWQVSGIADFNRDGQQDLLWFNSQTGAVRIWQQNNGAVQSIALGTAGGGGWYIGGLADFNSDGSTDIIWHNRRDGQAALWFLNNTRLASGAFIGSSGAGDWRVQGIADQNADRAPDLVWFNPSTGETATWLLNQGKLAQGVFLNPAPSKDWKLTGLGDFNGNGSSDLFWRNDRTGETQFWLYNGTQRTGIRTGNSISSAWQALAAADLNRDNTIDLLWRNSSTGELLAWFVQNGSVSNSATVLTESELNWQPIAALERSTSPLITPTQTVSPPKAPISNSSLATAENQAPTFSRRDRVDANNLNDFYRFTIGQSGIFTAGLTGLTGDADVRLIQDANGNGAIDNGEILAWQWERGLKDESIRRFIAPGAYFVQVLSYNNQAADFTVSTNFTAAASDDQQFRIQLNFADSLNGLTSAARDAINQAAKFWESAILSRSAITQSNILPIALIGQNLMAQDGTADAGTLALSGPSLTLDAANNLVITRGSSTLNTRRLAEFNANPLYLRDIMIHEFAHVLGFGTIWQPLRFSFTDGSTETAGKDWIDRATATYRADSYAGAAYGDLIGSFTPTAIPIEPQIFYHWDETRFDTELMTPFAEVAGTLMPLSSLTLGSLRDLGWNVNFGAVQPYSPPINAAITASTPGTQSTSQKPSARLAAYKCGCGRCLAAARTELIAPKLTDQIAA
ncbi:VCBS repeat-containing protein [Leptolyngbya sp. FACHB-17]|uniref:FG-GAP repeat domain-containing protein n=1 Tax=unclassified Leptolyngbya TaxID=2650499 RepID=UPI0016808F02|nr:VCBS repeat-containing protein [Leptolyngbya sp. FACHB-17]MBD2082771.1 VCBS repeat-containing protein [Leptolyngbya sp. FACHB-17]